MYCGGREPQWFAGDLPFCDFGQFLTNFPSLFWLKPMHSCPRPCHHWCNPHSAMHLDLNCLHTLCGRNSGDRYWNQPARDRNITSNGCSGINLWVSWIQIWPWSHTFLLTSHPFVGISQGCRKDRLEAALAPWLVQPQASWVTIVITALSTRCLISITSWRLKDITCRRSVQQLHLILFKDNTYIGGSFMCTRAWKCRYCWTPTVWASWVGNPRQPALRARVICVPCFLSMGDSCIGESSMCTRAQNCRYCCTPTMWASWIGNPRPPALRARAIRIACFQWRVLWKWGHCHYTMLSNNRSFWYKLVSNMCCSNWKVCAVQFPVLLRREMIMISALTANDFDFSTCTLATSFCICIEQRLWSSRPDYVGVLSSIDCCSCSILGAYMCQPPGVDSNWHPCLLVFCMSFALPPTSNLQITQY
jgi:hypothetical protein